MARPLLKREKIDSTQKYGCGRLKPLLYESAYSYCTLSTSNTLIDLYAQMITWRSSSKEEREQTIELFKKCIERYSSIKDGVGIVKTCFSLLDNVSTPSFIDPAFYQYIFTESIESNNCNMVNFMIKRGEQQGVTSTSLLTRMLSLFIMICNPSSDMAIPVILLKQGAHLTSVSVSNMIYTNRINLVKIMIEVTTSLRQSIRIKKRHVEFTIRNKKYRMLRLIVPIASRSVKQGSLKRMTRFNLIGVRVKELLSR